MPVKLPTSRELSAPPILLYMEEWHKGDPPYYYKEELWAETDMGDRTYYVSKRFYPAGKVTTIGYNLEEAKTYLKTRIVSTTDKRYPIEKTYDLDDLVSIFGADILS